MLWISVRIQPCQSRIAPSAPPGTQLATRRVASMEIGHGPTWLVFRLAPLCSSPLSPNPCNPSNLHHQINGDTAMPIILCEQRETAVVNAGREGEDLWAAPADLERATGWALKPEGLCRGSICIPLKPQQRAAMVRGDIEADGANARINLTGLWRGMGQPNCARYGRRHLGVRHRRGRTRADAAIARSARFQPDRSRRPHTHIGATARQEGLSRDLGFLVRLQT